MKRIVDEKCLQQIADEILSNVFMLELTSEDSAQDDIDFYVPRIRRAAEDLKRTISKSDPAPEGGRT